MAKKTPQIYNQEFRETAIKLALEGKKPVSEVAKELRFRQKRYTAGLIEKITGINPTYIIRILSMA